MVPLEFTAVHYMPHTMSTNIEEHILDNINELLQLTWGRDIGP